ncbi:MAG: hypothetical protein B6V02_01085 [Thermoprotei archaeon ex4572_64]|nr:MAG: hypothetical protein B6V02_01085 [Thermoprotei archaeon ex4572_64]
MHYPRLVKPLIDIAIPWNVLEEAPDEREKIRKIGYIGRGAAIFQVNKIIVYTYGKYDRREVNFLLKNLSYLKTPPHLRKHLFKIEKELKFSGLLPPLKTPSHGFSEPKVGDVREGIVVKWNGYYSIVKISDKYFAKISKPYPIGSNVIVKLEARTNREDTFRASVVSKDKLSIYWNVDVEIKGLREIIKSSEYCIKVFTGREGKCICDIIEEFVSSLKKAKKVLVIYGSPRWGVDDILRSENLEVELEKNFFINFVPEQGVETIRTEEAIILTLSIIHFMRTCMNV